MLRRPAERRERPERRGEPGVEHIGILPQFGGAAAGTSLRTGEGDDRLITSFPQTVPGRNLMSPPDLTGDAPILNVLHPAKVVRLPVLRNQPDFLLSGRGGRRRGRGGGGGGGAGGPGGRGGRRGGGLT